MQCIHYRLGFDDAKCKQALAKLCTLRSALCARQPQRHTDESSFALACFAAVEEDGMEEAEKMKSSTTET